MKALVGSFALDVATFVAMVSGIAALVACLFAPQLRFLAVPALLVLLPSLIYGMR